jgi:hypothetical protein
VTWYSAEVVPLEIAPARPSPSLGSSAIEQAGSAVAAAPADRRRQTLLLGLVLLLGLLLRLPVFARPLLSDDEAIYAVTADAMRRGDVLYRDVVDHKPPAIYDAYLAGYAVLGAYDTRGAHALVVLAALLCAAAVARSAERLHGSLRAGIAAALLWSVFSTTMLGYDSLAANCELFLVSLQAIAFAWLVRDRRGHPIGWGEWIGLGTLTGASVMFKYQGATFGAVLVAAAAFEWRRGRRPLVACLGALLAAAAGTLVVPALYVLRQWRNGGLDDAIHWFLFNFSYVAAGPTGWEAVRWSVLRVGFVGGLGATLLYVLGTWGVWTTIRDWWSSRDLATTRGLAPATPEPPSLPGGGHLEPRILALVWLATSAISLAAGGRFFGHYFHHVTPALSLLAAAPLARSWQTRRRWRPVLAAALVIPAGACLLFNTVLRAEVVARTDPEPDYDRVVAALRRVAGVDDRVFVWGNSPQIYVLSERPMGTRFSFCNYQTGISPGTRTETGEADASVNSLPDSWDELFADLERRQPRWILDAAAAGWDGYAAFPISRYPRLEAYIRQRYVLAGRVDGVGFYERSAR